MMTRLLLGLALALRACPGPPPELDPLTETDTGHPADATAACGNLGQACCARAVCQAGGMCVAHTAMPSPAPSYTSTWGTCVTASACGGPGAPCCADGSCRVDTLSTPPTEAFPVVYRCNVATHTCQPPL